MRELSSSELSDLTELLADIDVPEPPAGFWDELSDRVHRAVAAEPPPSRWRWPAAPVGIFAWQPALAIAAAVLIAVTATVLVMQRVMPGEADRASAPAAVASSTAEQAAPIGATPAASQSLLTTASDPLDLMAELSAGLDWDETSAAGLMVSPASTEAAVETLSDDQRAELVKLLQEQLQQ